MEFEDIAVTNQRWSLDGSTLYLSLITGVEVELHGKTQTTIILHRHHRPFTKTTTRRLILHNETGPARISQRGHRTHRMWYLEGRRMPERVWKKIINKDVTMDDIVRERNTEVRMLMLKAMGVDNLLTHATKIDESVDECGRPRILWEYVVREADDTRRWVPSVRVRFVEVYNSSPPYERFLLYVPAETKTADEAVRWTFPTPEGVDYDPDASS